MHSRIDCICEIDSDRVFKYPAPWLDKEIWPNQKLTGHIVLYDSLSYSLCLETDDPFGTHWFWVPMWDVEEGETL